MQRFVKVLLAPLSNLRDIYSDRFLTQATNIQQDHSSWKSLSVTLHSDGLDDTSVYLIEWRGGLKKKPKGRRPLYEATVHKIAEKQCTLEKLMRTQRQSSPKLLSKRKCRPNPKFVEEETSNDGPSSPKKKCQNSSVQCASWGNGLKQRSRAHRNNWHHLPPYRKLLKFTKAQEFVCQKNVFWSASHANSPTTMARMLLLGVFDIETLLKSNLRGGKSKNANPGETNVAMDRAKINAIIRLRHAMCIALQVCKYTSITYI
ncbi:hypothetical protein PHYPO_G00079060 [Pangasianodon hypophthalmus]|uniref:Uncharacterized protein n=1 Tax=Pangasianodon hypophthalmus TaxID=310915 RepID=A0A5N5LMV3_PANHP|nr:hypothetical protein PHYPO_G00079060 [Pangasianodon hypophthalmus]